VSSKLKRLGSLADIYQAEHLDGTITKIKIDKIHPSNEQPRQNRTLAVDELMESIKKDGLLSPIVITRDGEGYRIIAGERRYHAVKKLGWPEVECRIISRQERDYWRIAIIENLQRENLSAPEEASALLRLKMQENYSDAELASIVGKSRNYVTEILGIAGLGDDVLKQCRELGLDTKNMLIQVVQAEKKGGLKEFLTAVKAGSIGNIRTAREFNQGREKSSPRTTTETPSKKSSRGIVSMEVKGNELRIVLSSPEKARQLETLLKSRPPL